MKKTFIVIAFVLLVSFPTRSYGAAVAGALEPTQILNMLILTVQEGLQMAQKAATIAMKVKSTVVDPMTALFGANAGKQIESETQRWLMSGFQGDPLIVINPEAYIKNSQTNALRRQIALLEANRTASSEGIIINLIKQRRAELSRRSPEPADTAPGRIQNSLCENNGAQLARIIEEANGAIELGQAGEGGDFNTMYNDICMGDPRDTTVQKKLLAIESNSNYFSWDSWLNRTVEGNNDYTRGVLTALEVKRRTDEAAKLAEKESASGFLPDKRCVEEATRPETDGDGVETGGEQVDCVAWETLKPGESVSKLAQQVDINQLLKPLFTATKETNLASDALSGIGDVFKGIQAVAGYVGQVQQIGQQFSDLRGSINSLTGDTSYLGSLGAGGSPNTASINYIGTLDTYSSVGQSAFVNRSGVATSTESTDNSTQAERDVVATPAKDAIRAHQAAMARLPGQLSQIDSYVNQYQNFVNGITSCTQNIRASAGYMPATDDPQINNFTSRTNAKKVEILDPITALTTPIRAKMAVTNTFLANTLRDIGISRNISKILSLFQDYRDAISRGVIISLEATDEVDSIMLQKLPIIQKEVQGRSDERSGTEPIKTIFDECEQYLQQVNGRGGSQSGG